MALKGIRTKKRKDDEYIVPSVDHMGRSTTLQFHAIPAMARQIEMIVGQRKFPFETNGDLLRWALFQGLESLQKEKRTEPGFLAAINIEITMMRDEAYMLSLARHSDNLEKIIAQVMDGSPTGIMYAKGLIAKMVENAKRHKSGVWRKRHLANIKKKFGHIVEMEMPKVSLDPDEYDENENENEDADVGEDESGENGAGTDASEG